MVMVVTTAKLVSTWARVLRSIIRGPRAMRKPTQNEIEREVHGIRSRKRRGGKRLEKRAFASREAVSSDIEAGEPCSAICALLYIFAATCPDMRTAAGNTPG
jgi:hypothetical protein